MYHVHITCNWQDILCDAWKTPPAPLVGTTTLRRILLLPVLAMEREARSKEECEPTASQKTLNDPSQRFELTSCFDSITIFYFSFCHSHLRHVPLRAFSFFELVMFEMVRTISFQLFIFHCKFLKLGVIFHFSLFNFQPERPLGII